MIRALAMAGLAALYGAAILLTVYGFMVAAG